MRQPQCITRRAKSPFSRLIDFTNGAATATLDALVFLQSLGFQCEAFRNSRLDSRQEVLVEELLARRGLAIRSATPKSASMVGE